MALQMLFETGPTHDRRAPIRPPDVAISRQSTRSAPVPGMQTILVVDDESDIADSFQELLERSLPNVRVITATTALEALNILGREVVDLILTDYRMPGMDGSELLQRADRIAPGVPRMVVSAHPEEVSGWLRGRHRLDRFISKPVDAQVLVDAVGDCLARRP